MQRRVIGRVLCAACLLMLFGTSAAHGQSQTVASSGGAYGYAMGADGKLDDGRYIRYSAFFAHPQGAVSATGPAGGLDLSKPIGVLEVDAVVPPAAPNTWGSAERLCGTAANTPAYGAGHAVPARQADGAAGTAWTGVWFDVRCDARLGFDFFRVHFDHNVWDGSPQAADYFDPSRASVGSGSATTFGMRIDSPQIDGAGRPIVNEHETVRQWGAPGLLGTLAAEPLMRQRAEVTLCGHRNGAEVRCWGGSDSTATMYPSTAGMTHTVAPR